MRIGIDCRLWNQTGVGRYITNLVISLEKIDNKNDYVLFVRKEDVKDIGLKVRNVRWKIVETNINWHSIAEQINFPKVLEKENLDLVHFPYFSLPIFYKKPYVVTIHDLIINHYPSGKASTLFPLLYYLKHIAYKFIIKKASKNAKKIIVPSVATKNEVIEHLKIKNEKIVVTYEASDLATSKNKEQSGNEYGKYFLYVGNAYPHKNLDNLIKAFNNFSKEKNIKLILVGKKDYFYKRLEQATKSEKVIFYGPISDGKLSVFYKNAMSLIMPSLMEGFGLPVLEAMENKCLVICSDIPSLREIVKDNALYFNPNSLVQIEEVMDRVYNQKFEKEKIEKAYKLAKEFSWKKMAQQTLKIYESCIGL